MVSFVMALAVLFCGGYMIYGHFAEVSVSLPGRVGYPAGICFVAMLLAVFLVKFTKNGRTEKTERKME